MKSQGRELGLPPNCLPPVNRTNRQEGLATLATFHTQPTKRVCITGEDSRGTGSTGASHHSDPKAIQSSLAPSEARG